MSKYIKINISFATHKHVANAHTSWWCGLIMPAIVCRLVRVSQSLSDDMCRKAVAAAAMGTKGFVWSTDPSGHCLRCCCCHLWTVSTTVSHPSRGFPRSWGLNLRLRAPRSPFLVTYYRVLVLIVLIVNVPRCMHGKLIVFCEVCYRKLTTETCVVVSWAVSVSAAQYRFYNSFLRLVVRYAFAYLHRSISWVLLSSLSNQYWDWLNTALHLFLVFVILSVSLYAPYIFNNLRNSNI